MSLKKAEVKLKSYKPFLISIFKALSNRNQTKLGKTRYYGNPLRNEPYTLEIKRASTSISYRSARVSYMFKINEDYLNLYEVITRRARSFPDTQIMGQREILAIEDETQPDGRVLKKYRMKNEYSWMTYREMMDRVDNMAAGLLSIGLKSNDNIVIFAETRQEWLISAIACFKIKVPIVTLYATLGMLVIFNNFRIFIH